MMRRLTCLNGHEWLGKMLHCPVCNGVGLTDDLVADIILFTYYCEDGTPTKSFMEAKLSRMLVRDADVHN